MSLNAVGKEHTIKEMRKIKRWTKKLPDLAIHLSKLWKQLPV